RERPCRRTAGRTAAAPEREPARAATAPRWPRRARRAEAARSTDVVSWLQHQLESEHAAPERVLTGHGIHQRILEVFADAVQLQLPEPVQRPVHADRQHPI